MFNYNNAFSRNIGWITEKEQQIISTKRVAIAAGGGVGGEHMVTLARLGIQKFNISDFDVFEEHNFNRQAGAFISTIGQEKVEVMQKVVLDINPNSDVNVFPMGTTPENVDEFLKDVDIYVDSLDFFALSARKLVFKRCEELGIPVVTAAPLGMGCAFLCFTPDSMSYEEYFRFEECKDEDEQLIKFLIGLSPSMLQRPYLVDPSTADFNAKKGPSIPMSVKLCAGMACTYVLKILLGRGELVVAPWGLHFDIYRNKFKKTWRPMGNANPLQKIVFNIAKKVVFE